MWTHLHIIARIICVMKQLHKNKNIFLKPLMYEKAPKSEALCKMEDFMEDLNPEELLSIQEFHASGDTKQLLAPDLTNLSQYWYRNCY